MTNAEMRAHSDYRIQRIATADKVFIVDPRTGCMHSITPEEALPYFELKNDRGFLLWNVQWGPGHSAWIRHNPQSKDEENRQRIMEARGNGGKAHGKFMQTAPSMREVQDIVADHCYPQLTGKELMQVRSLFKEDVNTRLDDGRGADETFADREGTIAYHIERVLEDQNWD